MSDLPELPDAWSVLRRHTPARIGLGRVGASLPTGETLRFAAAQARARDAVHEALDMGRLVAALGREGFAAIAVASRARDRAEYLRRPDLGRRLSAESAARLGGVSGPEAGAAGRRMTVMVADGLSALAAARHAVPLLVELRNGLPGWSLDVVVAEQARVALGDEVGALRGAGAVAVLIGERPGLSSPDSLGVYVTYAPRVGRTDAERNCISNVREGGLGYREAARTLVMLLAEMERTGASGVGVKDRSLDGELDGGLDGRLDPGGSGPDLLQGA